MGIHENGENLSSSLLITIHTLVLINYMYLSRQWEKFFGRNQYALILKFKIDCMINIFDIVSLTTTECENK